ncbi:hypothetical protein OAH36_03305 [Verrucomicrobia bacterium]|nr:hypothetical protein [Verrucomicrobiota bacterium]MDB4798606.1 hypothetical protein [Verrucomicrobiota bacterium]
MAKNKVTSDQGATLILADQSRFTKAQQNDKESVVVVIILAPALTHREIVAPP